MRNITTLTLFLGVFLRIGMAQTPTIGLIQNTPESFDGYTLVSANSATQSHLIDNCGRVINQWESDYRMGESSYLLEDGSLLRTARVAGSVFFGGGIGGRLERFSWDGALEWSFDYASEEAHHHHDMAVLPNGNILLIAWEYHSNEEAQALGRLGDSPLWPPQIVEIEPVGTNGGNIVWEWHAWDHLIQNVDPNLPNYGEPADFPHRFDINYESPGGGGPMSQNSGDWFHCNAIHYNATWDQIMLNSRRWNEFYIIDHSTTSDEAASSSGGAAGQGGDVLYRWGNPEAYGRGEVEDRQLFGQHDPHWIHYEEGGGSESTSSTVLLFNNGASRPGGPRSSVDELTLPLLDDGTYVLLEGEAFGPSDFDWTYPAVLDPDFYSSFISGAQRLPNGNTLVCEGDDGKLFEVTATGEKVWEYVTATSQFGPNTQGNEPLENGTFRAYRYGPDYPGLAGRDLTPGEPVELAPYPSDCTTTSEGTRLPNDAELPAISFGPIPFSDHFSIQANRPTHIALFDAMGRSLLRENIHETMTYTWGYLPAGSYILRWEDAIGNVGSTVILKL